jgi:hypothetical protein
MDYDYRDERFGLFLSALAAGQTVGSASLTADLNWRALYGLRKSDPDFAEAWDRAILAGGRRLPGKRKTREALAVSPTGMTDNEGEFGDARFDVFLLALEAGHTVGSASSTAGLNWRALYGLRNSDPHFAEAWDRAILAGGRLLPSNKAIDQEAIRIFLEALASGEQVGKAAEKADFNPVSFYRHRKKDPNFASEWDEATARAKARIFVEDREPAIKIFLEAVEAGITGPEAARKAGFNLTTFYRLKRVDQKFGDSWKAALERGRHLLKRQRVIEKYEK